MNKNTNYNLILDDPFGKINKENKNSNNNLDNLIKDRYDKLKKGGTYIIFFEDDDIKEVRMLLKKFKNIEKITWIQKVKKRRSYLPYNNDICAFVAIKGTKPTLNKHNSDNGIHYYDENCENLKDNLVKRHSNEGDKVIIYGENNDINDEDKVAINDVGINDVGIQKPFIKWIGGKTQIIDKLMTYVPSEINNYHEIFLGGGSVLLSILSLKTQNKIIIKGKIYAYDLNKTLINVYINVQKNPKNLYKNIEIYKQKYHSLKGDIINRKPLNKEEGETSKESYYYWLRQKFNKLEDKSSIDSSALFIFINKICFRGMYREGPSGFNVPYGHYKTTPNIADEQDLLNISNLIKDVVFIHTSFEKSIEKTTPGDFVYLDPPYVPENLNSFVGYTKKGFNLDLHKTLFKQVKNLDNKINFVLSNSNVDFVRNSFKNFNCDEITTRRSINSKKPQSTTGEVIIYN